MIFSKPFREMTPTRRVWDNTVTPGNRDYEPDPYYQSIKTTILNKDLDLVYAPDFYPVTEIQPCPSEAPIQGYVSNDPRLMDVLRNNRLVLDRPVYQPAHIQPLCIPKNETPPKQPSTGIYPTYASITGGNSQYYVDDDISHAFYAPVYQIPSMVQPSIYQDPMGGLKAYYQKTPILRQNNALSEYSFDQDQMSFREDIMSRQSSLMDRSDYQKFHYHFNGTNQ